jgi:peptidoglycan hydrolase FlgJ
MLPIKDNYFDQNALNSVKAMGRQNDPAALKEIAKKFEAMFVQQMLKSMRDANAVFGEDNVFSSKEVEFHQGLMDQQMVLNLTSGEGIGLAKTMYQQMQTLYGKPAALEAESDALNTLARNFSIAPRLQPLVSTLNETALGAGRKTAMAHSQAEFIATLKPHAEKAAAELKVNSDVLLAQAALETGWGKHLIHDAQGNNSFNMFNIKASGWQGKSVTVNTLETRQGVTQQERASFRQYDNYAQSFADYVALIKNNARYQGALAAGANSENYAEALQSAGYATDPDYAAKIKSLLNSDAIRSAAAAHAASAAEVQS